jgi:hypothetical protein
MTEMGIDGGKGTTKESMEIGRTDEDLLAG